MELTNGEFSLLKLITVKPPPEKKIEDAIRFFHNARLNRMKTADKEYKINDYITLRKVDDKTHIYVKGIRFIQCIRLLLSLPNESLSSYAQINSIDEAIEIYDKFLYKNKIVRGPNAREVLNQSYKIDPDEEFKGHCSNLQVWAENNYDTRLLHSNIAFPLLRRLAQVGDQKAKSVFEEEIVIRLESGHPTVVKYLIAQGYLKYLSPAKINVLLFNLFEKSDDLITIHNLIKMEYFDIHFKELIRDNYKYLFSNNSKFKRELLKAIQNENLSKELAIPLLRSLLSKSHLIKNFIIDNLIVTGNFEIFAKSPLRFLIHDGFIEFFPKRIFINKSHMKLIRKEIFDEIHFSDNIPTTLKNCGYIYQYLGESKKTELLKIIASREDCIRFIAETENLENEEILIPLFRDLIRDLLEFKKLKYINSEYVLKLLRNLSKDAYFKEIYFNEILSIVYLGDKKSISRLIKYGDLQKLTPKCLKLIFHKINFTRILYQILVRTQSKKFNYFYGICEILLRAGDTTIGAIFEKVLKNSLKILHQDEIIALEELDILNFKNIPMITTTTHKDLLQNLKSDYIRIINNRIQSKLNIRRILQFRLSNFGDKVLTPLFNLITSNLKWVTKKYYSKILLEKYSKNVEYLKEKFINFIQRDNFPFTNQFFINFAYKLLQQDFWNFIDEGQVILEIEKIGIKLTPIIAKSASVRNGCVIKGRKINGLFLNLYQFNKSKPLITHRFQRLSFLEQNEKRKMIIGSFINHITKCHSLQQLTLNYCNIERLPDSFGELKNLKELNLSNNLLEELPELSSGLMYLNLSYNRLQTIPPSIGNLISLETLILNHNEIQILPMILISLKSSLKFLNISNNKLIKITSNIKNFHNLTFLNLSFNRTLKLHKIPKLPSSIIKLDLSFNEFYNPDSIAHLINLRELNLSKCNLHYVPNVANFKRMNKLNLSHNFIKNISGLQELKKLGRLVLNNNSIKEINGISNLKYLTYLSLSSNLIKSIKNLDNQIFLIYLDLSRNEITEISNISQLTHLRVLRLEQNEINKINCLENLVNLESLYLNSKVSENINFLEENNNKNSLPNIFKTRTYIKKYQRKLISKRFQNGNSLKYVKVKNNRIYVFNNVLDLRAYKIRSLNQIIGLDKLKNLKVLFLASNKIETIENLDCLENLEQLVLSWNKISHITGLSNLKRLKYLNLFSNNVNEISGLESLKKLEILNVAKNNIREIKGLEKLETFKKKKLKIFNIALNPVYKIDSKCMGTLGTLDTLVLPIEKISPDIVDQISEQFSYRVNLMGGDVKFS